jgi:hypothetical protein
MTSQCPRCGAQRVGEFCQSCGLDFRTAAPAAAAAAAPVAAMQQPPYGAPPQPPVPQQPAYGQPPYQQPPYQQPVYQQPPNAPAKGSNLPILLGLLLVVALVAAAAGYYFVIRPQGGTSAASPTLAALVTPTHAATPTAAETSAPTLEPTPTAALGDAGWLVFAPVGDGFTSKFPVKPTLTTQTYKTAAGDAPSSLWTDEESSDLAYFALFAQYPKGSMSGVGTSAVYDGAVSGMTGGTTGLTVDTQGSVTLNGHPGRKFVLTGSAASIKGQMYLVGDNLYMIYAAYTSNITDLTDVDTFIADFKLTV